MDCVLRSLNRVGNKPTIVTHFDFLRRTSTLALKDCSCGVSRADIRRSVIVKKTEAIGPALSFSSTFGRRVCAFNLVLLGLLWFRKHFQSVLM